MANSLQPPPNAAPSEPNRDGMIRFVRRTLGLSLLLLGSSALFNFIVDPLQVYRRASYPPHFSENQRYQNPGLARNYAEPVVVIGTSHTENWLPADIESSLGQAALKLSVSGSGLYEQGHLLDLALSTGRVQRVIWGIDHGSTLWMDEPTEEFGPFPRHLYGSLWLGSAPYLLSVDTLSRSWAVLVDEPQRELAELNAWYAHTAFGLDRIVHAWKVVGARWDDALYAFYADRAPNWAEVKALMERRMLARIRRHPEVRFDLVFMPHSIWEYVNDFRVERERFFQRLLMKRQIAGWARRNGNIRLWDFETKRDWIFDPGRYSDLAHFDLATTRAMIAALGTDDPWPVAPSTALVDLVLEEMARLCRGETPGEGDWCPARIACGRWRLESWMRAGGDDDSLLAAAHARCPEQPAER